MRIPENIRRCVAFVGFINQTDESFQPVGSVFFVGRENEGGTANPVYAVTAKHVIDALRNKGVSQTIIRVNMKNGTSQTGIVRVAINSWFVHQTDNSLDIAIHKMGIPEQVDHLVLPMSLFATKEKMAENEVSLGDEVFVVGLFRHHVGRQKNIPIIRTGNLAAMDEEKVSTRDFGNMNAYLIEARSIGGLSGSPVVLNLGFVRSIGGKIKHMNSNNPAFFLIGLIHGHYDVPDSQVDDSSDDATILSNEKINTGIAIVTPYYSLLHVIENFESLNK